ncbi:MAG: protein kinase [Pyrinomonadaceae bacterium]
MGEVYAAHDPKIGRVVAIKVLSADQSQDSDRLARFEQEAHAAGSLNHPNIVAVYDIDIADGTPYVVSELLEGETLRSAIGTSPMPVRRAMDYGMQIALGLAAAHERGIIHRDLKPENIFITSDGRVKILDFGLAKLVQPDLPSGETFSDEITHHLSTDPGTIMGTMAYMSPEQVRGQEVDARTDIFSFGAVFYEMLTGRKAFLRESTADTITAILREELPDVSVFNSFNPGLDRIVEHCLAKNKEQRFHSASDLAFALEALANNSGQTGQTASFQITSHGKSTAGVFEKLRDWGGWAAAGILLFASLIFAGLYFGHREVPLQVMRFALPAPENAAFDYSSSISPDGRSVAFTAKGSSGETMLWVRSLGTMEARIILGTAGTAFPFWSPDSREIGFFALGKLKKVAAEGGTPQILAEASPTGWDARGGAWSSNGTILYSPNVTSPLYKVSAAGGTPTIVTELDPERAETSHRWPSFLPDGNTFLYFGRGNSKDLEGIFAARLDGSEPPRMILQTEIMGSYVPPTSGKGNLLFVRNGVLFAQPFDPDSLERSGEASSIADDVVDFATEVGPTAYAEFSASNNGNLLYRTDGDQTTRFYWFDRSGKELAAVTEPGNYREPRISPDGKRIVYVKSDGGGEDLHILDLATGGVTKMTFDPADDVTAVWSRDGSRIVFASNRNGGTLKLYQKMADGTGAEQLLYSGTGNLRPDDFTPDGSMILFDFDSGTAAKNDLMLLPVGGGESVKYLRSQFTEAHAMFSPDGRWVAYTSDESGKLEIFVQSYPEGGGKWQITTGGGDHPQWSRTGRELFYLSPDRNLMAVPVDITGTFSFGKPAGLFTTKVPLTSLSGDRNNFLASPDGQRFFINSLVDERNTKPLTLVLNWENGVRR